MTLSELIKSRRSIRSYNSRHVDDATIDALIEAAIWAPSGSNLQMIHYVIVRDHKSIGLLKWFSPGMPKSAGCVLALCINLKEAGTRGGTLGRDVLSFMDVAFASQNILLKAHEMGLGTCVVRSFLHDPVKQLLSLPEDYSPMLLISAGYYDETPQAPPRPDPAGRKHYEKW